MEHVLQRSRQAVELPDDDNIALVQLVEHAVQLGTVPAPAAGNLLEDVAAAEGLGLQCIALLVSFGVTFKGKWRGFFSPIWRPPAARESGRWSGETPRTVRPDR